VRVAKVLETLLGITGIVLESAEVGPEAVVFDVRPRRKKPRCGGCGKRAPGYDQREARQWRHLNLGATRIWLRYVPRRVEYARCGVVNEQVPWGSAGGWFSSAFEETTAYRSRVIASSDCGFGTFAGWEMVAPSVVWAKLRALREGAELASKRLWG
jgi:transposase